jgi:endonuclease G
MRNIKFNTLLIICLFIIAKGKAQTLSEQIKQLEIEKNELLAKQLIMVQKLEQLKLQKIAVDLNQMGLPTIREGSQLVEHCAMILSYNDKHEQPNWVTHVVTPDVRQGNLTRTNDFREDSLVKSGSATKDDYWDSGYDRGHIAPSADFRWSAQAISESYFYSNMSPQRPEFNRERWAELENWIREAVLGSNEQIIVIAGPVLREGLPQLTQGPNKVSIPEYCYKVVLDIEGPDQKAIGFVLPNKSCPYPVISYAVSVDSIERLTGLKFFGNLSPELQVKLKKMADPTKWEQEVEAASMPDLPPMTNKQMPKNCVNTIDALYFLDQKITVCGTVVSTKKTKSGAVFINLDIKFPKQIFSVSIWEKDSKNFSYAPENELLGRKVCITGTVKDYKGTPSMNISDEKKIRFLDEED